ncbi:peptide/nickel transport system ATP-binding protein [Dethiosulfatibacter aminovorans DSM 17477]|uniref:Peptide/nickel transport system ATP-binding protein n=1 Tax=Dethiosulfatibacter aminovorans DSM 17477 TaxID=1121476 RepID=A0A1M6F9T7_9FIRM|nr:ABC transporter ATP-binding protein [Dethiosulfatibacter aminovorans]SHI94426.1 peptide/nickel transport system ATP-binding protein [Dethiosulfatibacter aminovorans DSM 17477]
MALLDLKNLSIEYKLSDGKLKAVDDVSLTIDNGDILGLVGESGCGKSTLIKGIINLLPSNGKVTEGEVVFNDEVLNKLSVEDMRKKRWKEISLITQSAMNSLNPVYKVGKQIIEPMIEHDKTPKDEAMKKAEQLFELVGLEKGRLQDYPHQYSGGMKQRAIIAMSLALDPKLIIADEPTTALDVIVQSQILERINMLLNQYDGSMILVTHDISVVAQTCTKVAVMYGGKIIEYGDVNQVLKRPNHPYTMGLKNAFPSLVGDKKELISIEGTPPDLSKEIIGCRFAERCPFVQGKCRKGEIKKTSVKNGYFYCARAEERDELMKQADIPSTWESN